MPVTSVKLGIIFGFAVAALSVGLALGILWPNLFTSILFRKLILSPTSMSFGIWKETPIPMYLEIYLFNWTNADNFSSTATTKPNFVELGPYVFKEVDYKVNEVWHDNGTVTFQQKRIWHFEESMSKGSLLDKVTNLNVIATTIAYSIRHRSPLVRQFVNTLIRTTGETRITTKTAGELLFDGYKDPLLEMGLALNYSGIPYDKFGWFYDRNNSETYDGTFNMFTGATDVHKMGVIEKWNYSNTTEFSGYCGILNGTNGDLWPPLPDNKTVSIFSSDLCTSLSLTMENTTVYQGLVGNKYISDNNIFDNGTNVPSRKCFCEGVECQPSGVLNVSECRFGAPAFISLPHFYLADESYRDSITGMNPDKEKHEFSITLEPTTGVPLQIRAMLQINVLVQPDNAMSLFRNIPKTYVPMMWFKQEADLSSNYASQITFLLILPTLGYVTFYGIAAIGVLLFFIGIALLIRGRWGNNDGQQRLITKEVNNDVPIIDG
ncbi:protein croquemort isoform X2 [Cephus cinctus]|nr:protein croquemort isoform X2 [Cephus cinctus]XP_024942407.1 protein croquemort isoform X2 [Cephus cinctus]XP_024942408.1 protein croquemort isoform X2 [Cephus cinctus]